MKRPLLVTVGLALGGLAGGALAGVNVARAEEGASLTPTTSAGGGAATAAAPTTTPSTTDSKAHSAGAGLGLNPNTPQLTGGTNLSTKEAESLTPTTTSASADEWKFDFHGYMRAPLRVSMGPPSPTSQPANAGPGCQMDPNCYNSIGSGLQLHGFPRVPGANYVTWDYTNTVPGPWAQLNFSYGNSRAMMTIIVDSYSQTSAGYRNLQAQQGIDQAFLTLNFPEAFGDRGGIVLNAGSFQNRYGTAGKYDGGMYETYLFGRTHVAGLTATANIDATPEVGVTLEVGGGSKIEVVPFTNNQLFQVFKGAAGANCTGPMACGTNQGFGYQNYLSDRDAEYLPYAGPVPQGSTYLAHAHLGASWRKMLTLGTHFLYTWTPDDNWSGVKPDPATGALPNNGLPGNSQQANVSDHVPRYFQPIQGSMMITGADLRLSLGAFGDGYVGFSYINAKNINALADAVEVLHSFGGWQFKENFFGVGFNPQTGEYRGPQNETGTVKTVEAQYTISFGALARYPAAFWGQGPDLAITLFGMLSMVNSPAPFEAPIGSGGGADKNGNPLPCDHSLPGAAPYGGYGCWNINTKKLKFGGDIAYTPLPTLGFGFRYDMVEPDMNAAFGGSQENFQVFTPRLVIKTAFVTHEAITFQYQRYILGQQAYAIYPNQWVPKADPNLFAVSATMWW